MCRNIYISLTNILKTRTLIYTFIILLYIYVCACVLLYRRCKLNSYWYLIMLSICLCYPNSVELIENIINENSINFLDHKFIRNCIGSLPIR